MSKVHGIVYAYHSSPRLGDLTRYRTNASLPFCGRYRLIDFALSSLSNYRYGLGWTYTYIIRTSSSYMSTY